MAMDTLESTAILAIVLASNSRGSISKLPQDSRENKEGGSSMVAHISPPSPDHHALGDASSRP